MFDISQTEGEDLDLDLVRPQLLEGEAPKASGMHSSLRPTTPASRSSAQSEGGANAYCDCLTKEIGVDPYLSDLQSVKTLVHELGHALLHTHGAEGRDIAEVEIESVAVVVLDALGLASDDYSFPYVPRWAGGDLDKIKETAERVASCAASTIGQLEDDKGTSVASFHGES